MPTFYFSFADDEWLGACIVSASNEASALLITHALGINPGGDVIFVELDAEKAAAVPEEAKNRLLDKDDLREHFGELVQIDI